MVIVKGCSIVQLFLSQGWIWVWRGKPGAMWVMNSWDQGEAPTMVDVTRMHEDEMQVSCPAFAN